MNFRYCSLEEFLTLRPDWSLVDVAEATGYDYGTIRNIRSRRKETEPFQRSLWLVLEHTKDSAA